MNRSSNSVKTCFPQISKHYKIKDMKLKGRPQATIIFLKAFSPASHVIGHPDSPTNTEA
jgi:hypothetical protein